MARDLARELQNYDGSFPPTWKPTGGETLVGRIVTRSTVEGRHGPVETVGVQKEDGSRVTVWVSSTVLKSQFEQQKPRIGERIGLKFIGVHPTKNYKNFALVVDRDEDAKTETDSPDEVDHDFNDPFASDETPYASKVMSSRQ